MEIPEHIGQKKISVFENQPKKNLSDSDIDSRQFSITSDDDDVDENLHIVGFKVRLGNDETYSFNLGKTKSKSADVLTFLTDSNKLELSSVRPCKDSEDHTQSKNNITKMNSENERLDSFSDPDGKITGVSNTNSRASCTTESPTQPSKAQLKNIIKEEIPSAATQTDQEIESSSVQTSRIEVRRPRSTREIMIQTDRTKNASTFTEKVETDAVKMQTSRVEVRKPRITQDTIIQTDRTQHASTSTEEVETDSVKMQTSRVEVRKPQITQDTIIQTDRTQNASTSTEKVDTDSVKMQTSQVEVRKPRSTQETMIQTDRTQNASTSTEQVEAESAKIQTERGLKKQAGIQTEKEKETSSAQTETAAIYSIDRAYDASTQTVKHEDAGTSTSYDVYVINRENLTEKAVDTEELPFMPLIVAEKENAVIACEHSEDKDCHCFCGHRNHNRCIYKCCIHKESENLIPESLQCKGTHFERFSNGSTACNFCHCPSRNNCNATNTCNSMFRMDLHQSHCCKCVKLQSKRDQSKAADEETKSLKVPESNRISKMRLDSIAQQEKISSHSKVEVVKNLENGLEKNKIIIASRVFKSRKVERVSVLKVPVFFEHFLKSFNLSLYRSFRVVINPIKISLSLDEEALLGKKKDASAKPNTASKDKCPTEKNPNIDCNYMKAESLAAKKAFDEKKSQVCPRSAFYSNNQNISGKKRNFFQSDFKQCKAAKESKAKEKADSQTRSTSPKIKNRGFDYTSKDKWKPHKPTSDDVLVKKVAPTNITLVGQSPNDESFESAKTVFLKDACEIVNDHLLSLRFVDENTIRDAAEVLHKRWFEVAGTKCSDVKEVRNYMKYFEEFSNNLLRTLLYSVDNNGNNVLHFAFANNRFDLVEEFLNNGFGINILNKTNRIGNSPLMICSISQPKDNSEWSTVRKALEMGNVDVKSKKSGQTPLMNASSIGFYAMVNMLLDVGANPNVQDKDGSTALMYAAEHGHEKCIKSLVKHKNCDPTIQDKDGQTACSVALSNGHKNIAVLIHMTALEKRRLSQNSYFSQRYIWTNSMNKTTRKKAPMISRRLN